MSATAGPFPRPSPPQPLLADHRGLTDGVQEALLGLLMDREVAPGAPLRTEALAARLGVSATPVREALARLESTGLVQRTVRRGYRAAPLLGEEELAQLLDVRLVVEPGIAERACRRAGPEQIAALRASVATQRSSPTGPGYRHFKDYLAADWSFHQLLAEATGNPFLVRTLDSFRGFVHRLHQDEERIEDSVESVAEHEAVIAALVAGSPEAAAQAMREHLEGVRERARGH
ncbi:DNA-binding GntR family transcriptional regulator [Kineococcus xinjiangensis]|uniref:DNA-binding GntR family transcriptional regulator n=1 Tax=Kineococcus xinjiangensis TaxID=512762 RepID=A0A2S6IK69_9ACTN|nr:GntR family transcriptional regulator [Kineococcus xinjiangensis]PPK94632.1 DNA-binding GntR family transcriptional regulator [Kineococcus xinjiangensis]